MEPKTNITDDYYLMIGGEKIELPEEVKEQIKQAQEKEDSPFNVRNAERSYYVNWDMEIDYCDSDNSIDSKYGIECTDRDIIKQRALKFKLYCMLDKFTREHGWKDEYFKNDGSKKYRIVNNEIGGIMVAGSLYITEFEKIYFTSYEVAQQAIDEIVKPFLKKNPKFIW